MAVYYTVLHCHLPTRSKFLQGGKVVEISVCVKQCKTAKTWKAKLYVLDVAWIYFFLNWKRPERGRTVNRTNIRLLKTDFIYERKQKPVWRQSAHNRAVCDALYSFQLFSNVLSFCLDTFLVQNQVNNFIWLPELVGGAKAMKRAQEFSEQAGRRKLQNCLQTEKV